jgi:hypothetical protein
MMNWIVSIVLCLVALSAFPQTQSSGSSVERKLQYVEQNGNLQHPDPTPTVFTEGELNAYLAAGEVDFPQGVKSIRFHGRPGIVEAFTRVDFDAITASRRSANPLLMLFTGTHDVHVVARAKGSGGMGEAHVESVEIDGVAVPRAALQFFVERYVTPKYPEVGLDSRIKLPNKIDTATVGDGTLTITQK